MKFKRFLRSPNTPLPEYIQAHMRMLKSEVDEELGTPFQVFISVCFYVLLGVVSYVGLTQFINPVEAEKPSVDSALIAQCQSYDENPWVEQVGWDAPIESAQECPTVFSRLLDFADEVRGVCFDSYVTKRISPIKEFVGKRDLKTAKDFFKTLYYWPAALSVASIGQDASIKFIRCGMLAGVNALPISESSQESYQRLIRVGFHLRAARSLRRRLTKGLLATGAWHNLQTTAIAMSMEERGSSVREAIWSIDNLQEWEIESLFDELLMPIESEEQLRLTELKAQTLRFKLAAYLSEVRSDLSHAQDALYCMIHSSKVSPKEQDHYREILAGLLHRQCEISRKLVDIYDFYHHELPTRRRQLLWAAKPSDSGSLSSWLGSFF